MFGLFKRTGIPPRHRSSAYMNLAFGKLPTILTADWDTDPVGLGNLTDESADTHLTTDGACKVNLAAGKGIKIDLGQKFEVYEINVENRSGEGVKANNAANAGTVKVKTSLDDTTYTQRSSTQTPAGVAFEDMNVDYLGSGIPVRYVLVEFDSDASYFMTVDISEIKVFGC